uniref:Uncharacterized protein n=1 Tax=Zea mays TaxID=4577 RepID=A0A804PIR9_MAIZE
MAFVDKKYEQYLEAKNLRKTLGGGMRQVGVLCADSHTLWESLLVTDFISLNSLLAQGVHPSSVGASLQGTKLRLLLFGLQEELEPQGERLCGGW